MVSHVFTNAARLAMRTDTATISTHRCCSERNFLDHLIVRAKKKGIHRSRIVHWIKRKVSHVVVFRYNKLGNPVTSCPCELCRQELVRFGLFVSYIDADNQYIRRVRADELPQGVQTSSQKLKRHIG